ncbi:hypothetical protein [Orbus mooreae]|uniref:hypothetical protein n=1 Tax=Orbus mooreae TaxID=3074107 RepID=UPI00370D411B
MMKNIISMLSLFVIVFSVKADDNWLVKFTKKNNFTYNEFIQIIDENNKDLYQRLFAAGYYSGVINGSRTLNAVANFEGIPTLYCIPDEQRIGFESYVNFMKLYYSTLNSEQQKIVNDLPIEIVHLRTLKDNFPCKK